MRESVFSRYPSNPIIKAEDVKPSRPDWEVKYVINAGVTEFNGETLLLLRVAEGPLANHGGTVFYSPFYEHKTGKVEYRSYEKNDTLNDFSDPRFVVRHDSSGREVGRALSTISHLRVARSKGGIDFSIDENTAIFPSTYYEQFGIEDPRITFIEGKYYINYSAISPSGDATALAVTSDFVNYQRMGVIFTPDNKDVCIFPRKINGKYYAMNRPTSEKFGSREMWISESPDLKCWGNHKLLYSCKNDHWGCERNGCGAVPIELDQGWLEIYHAADCHDCYSLGLMLMDKNDPSRIIAVSPEPVMIPEEGYELKGFFGNVVFCCGALLQDNIMKIYYGCADTSIAMAEAPLQSLLDTLEPVK